MRKWGKHGQGGRTTRTPTYRVWEEMHQRCYNPKHPRYRNYGAVGISVCPEWHSYQSFLVAMGERPEKGALLGRLDVNGPYHPDNCRWMTHKDQWDIRRRFKAGEHIPAFTPVEDPE